MLISFNKEKKTFILKNNRISYIFYINKLGVLIKLYSGKLLNDLSSYEYKYITDVGFDTYFYYSRSENKEKSIDDYFSGYGSMLETPSYLSYDKRGALAIFTNEENSSLTDFRYVKHKIIKGKNNLENMPYFKIDNKEGETLIVTLKDIRDEVYLECSYTILKDLDVIIRKNRIINKSKNKIKINRLMCACLDLPSNDYSIISVHGIYANDRILESQDIKHNIVKISENSGAKGFYHNPVCMLKNKSANENSGETIGFGLVYSGNFSFEFIGTNLNATRCLLGINDENFEYVLNKNEDFVTPELAMIFSYSGTDYVTNTFHDLIRNHLLRKNEDNKKTILLNSWEGFGMHFSTDKIITLIKKSNDLGINLFVLDDGWFGKRNDDTSSLGDWYINKEKIDLKKCVEYAHSLKMKFGLWIEPEMISYNSDLYKNHPEYALYQKNVDPTLLRHQFVLDILNEKARNEVLDNIISIFKELKIDYCKWDFNRLLTESYSYSIKKENNKAIFHLFTLATYSMLDRFNKELPFVLLETCAGGGGRFDLGMLFYSSQIWASDETDAIMRSKIQYTTNMFYPLSTIGAHISSRKYLSIKEKGALAMFGTFGYELDITKLDENDLKEVEITNKRFLENKDLIDDGDYYSLINPFKNSNFVSFSVVSKNKDECIVFYMNYLQFNWGSNYLKLKGLDKNKLYKNDLNNQIYYGDFYMNIGLNLSIGMLSFTPLLIKLHEIK